MSSYEIRQGHSLDVLPSIPDASVHTVVTSPPYLSLRDYGIPPSEWPEVTYQPMAGLPTVTVPPMSCAFGLEPDVTSYIGHLVLIFRQVWRVMRPDASLWLNLGDSYVAGPTGHQDISNANGKAADMFAKGGRYRLDNLRKDVPRHLHGLKPKDLMMVPDRAALALQAEGYWLRSVITWCKRAPMPESVRDRPTSATEKIYLLTKSDRYFYDADAVREAYSPTSLPIYDYPRQNVGPAIGRYQPGHTPQEMTSNIRQPNPAGRNMWNYWLLGPDPYAEAHFATFPREIPRRAILAGTSERGVCGACGAPWRRVVEREGGTWQERKDAGHPMRYGMENLQARDSVSLGGSSTTTAGWEPTCKHNAPTIPATVLDPFAGAGTTLLVAVQLGRRSLGIELNPDYISMAMRRIHNNGAPLFSWADSKEALA